MSLDLIYAELNDYELYDGTGLNGVWTDIPGLSVGADSFTALSEYLVFVELNLITNHVNTTGTPFTYFRVLENGLNALPIELAHGHNSSIGGNYGKQYTFMFKYDAPLTLLDLTVEAKTEGVVVGNIGHLFNSKVWVLDLTALGTEGTDWVYAENRTEIADADAVNASVTFTPAAEDWMFIGTAWGGGQTTHGGSHGLDIWKDAAKVQTNQPTRLSTASYSGRETWRAPTTMFWFETLAAVSQTWGASARNTTTGRDYMSAIFGMRLPAVLGHSKAYDASYFQNPSNVFIDEAAVQLTHTTNVSAAESIGIGVAQVNQPGAIVDITDASSVSYLTKAPDASFSSASFPSMGTVSADSGSVSYHPCTQSARLGTLAAAGVRLRRRANAAFATTGYDSQIYVLDVDTSTPASAPGGGGGASGPPGMPMLGVG